MSVGERIQTARKRVGLSQKELAAKLHVSQPALAKWENDKSLPAMKRIQAIASILGISVEFLTSGVESNTKPAPSIKGKIPIISWSTAGDWGEVVDNFSPNDADGFVTSTVNVSNQAFALKIVGESMQPTIPDGATVIVDPNAQYRHKSIVIVRQNGDTEATCKRLIIEGETKYLQPDNDRYPVMKMMDDAVICGVVKQVSIEFD